MPTVWSGIENDGGVTLSAGDTVASRTGASPNTGDVRGVTQVTTSAKYYGEAIVTGPSNSPNFTDLRFGIVNQLFDAPGGDSVGKDINGWAVDCIDGDTITNNTTTATALGAFVANDVVQVAFDLATLKVWFGRNNTWIGDPGAGTGEAYTATGTAFSAAAQVYSTESVQLVQEADWAYTPPAGFGSFPAELRGEISLEVRLEGASLHAVDCVGEIPLRVDTDGRSVHGIFLSADLVAPAATGTGEGVVGTVLEGFGVAPAAIGVGYAPGEAQLVAPMPTITATGVGGSLMTAALVAPPPSVLASGDATTLLQASIVLPAISGVGYGVTGSICSAALTAPAPLVTAAASQVGVSSAALTAPPAVSSGQWLAGSSLSASLTTPMATVTGSSLETRDTQTLAFNPRNNGFSKYPAYPFTTVASIGGVLYGADATGLFRVTGDDDDGIGIPAAFLTGRSDFRSSALKKAGNVYAGYEADSGVTVTVTVDGDTSYTYTVDRDQYSSGQRPARATLGRGLRSRYWQVGMGNTLGADFRVDELGLTIARLKRNT